MENCQEMGNVFSTWVKINLQLKFHKQRNVAGHARVVLADRHC